MNVELINFDTMKGKVINYNLIYNRKKFLLHFHDLIILILLNTWILGKFSLLRQFGIIYNNQFNYD